VAIFATRAMGAVRFVADLKLASLGVEFHVAASECYWNSEGELE
jgi:hypothetical protein